MANARENHKQGGLLHLRQWNDQTPDSGVGPIGHYNAQGGRAVLPLDIITEDHARLRISFVVFLGEPDIEGVLHSIQFSARTVLLNEEYVDGPCPQISLAR